MINLKTCTEKQLWEYVAVELSKAGLKNILVGGAVAAIYSKGAYKSGDLDIVIDSYLPIKQKLEKTMNSLGFKKETRHWVHPDCRHLFVEFCAPPVAIGDESNIAPEEIKKEGVSIYILSPTDCVKDRLAGYIHWNARECLDQAKLVAASNSINLNEIEKWCIKEHPKGKDFFHEFKEELKK